MKKNFLVILVAFLGICSVQAQKTKTLYVPKIKCEANLKASQVPAMMDANLIPFDSINVVNWPSFSYKPQVAFRIAHTGQEILLHYQVTEGSVQALSGRDNGPVWEDSCVEFFVSPSSDSCYYNFECNCIGTLLIQGGMWKQRRPVAKTEILAKVQRWSSLGNQPFKEIVGEKTWNLVMVIPVSAFYLHSLDNLDGKVMKANFYKCGDKLQKAHFLTWNPILLKRPNFHTPNFFGELVFKK